jgi:hypothetical protein
MRVPFVFCVSLMGCNAILGIEDKPRRADAGGGSDAAYEASTDGAAEADSAAPSLYVQAVLEDAPMIYLRLGETSGLTAKDEMHFIDGTYTSAGVTWNAPGALLNDSNPGVSFDGTGSIHMGDGADFADRAPFSVEVWMNRAPGAGYNFVADHEAEPRHGWDLLAPDDGVNFERYADTTNLAAISTPPVSIGSWHHVVGSWDGSVERIFIDGALVKSSGAYDLAIGTITGGWTIGGQNCSCSGNSFHGTLDELAVYDKPLTGTRILAHWHASGR